MERFLQCLIVALVCCTHNGIAGKPPVACPSCNEDLYWTGEDDTDFFNELNWRQTQQSPPGNHPPTGTLEPGQPIPYSLYAAGSEIEADGPITFDAGKMLRLSNAKLNVLDAIENGLVSLESGSTVHLRSGSPLGDSTQLNLLDAASWIYFHELDPDELLASGIPAVRVNGDAGIPDSTVRINQYYQVGSIVRMISPGFTPLEIFSGKNFSQSSTALKAIVIYSGDSIPDGMNNAARSFRLKRGYMATFAAEADGTGKSKVYIATEEDLEVDALPLALQGNVSFIRVLPWNWVTKKGTGGFYDQLNAGWFYNWGNGENSRPNYEYVPMTWGAGATSPTSLNQIIAKEKVTHLLGFNESDDCHGQSGQYNNLCQPEVAVTYYENLMKTGLRLGTPAPRENGPNTWLKEFRRIATERDVRFDFVAVHWYDWGSNPQNSPYANAQQVFNRFKNYLNNVYETYQLPIWITEFNANPNRDNSVHAAFLELALPWLEETDFIERYAYFQPNTENASTEVDPSDFFDENGDITNIGEIYRDHVSTPSIPEATYASPNNLEGLDELPSATATFEAEDATIVGGATIAQCATASGGEQVNLGASVNNGVSFDSITVHATGTYRLEIAYMSAVSRDVRLLVNNNDLGVITVASSGSWCFQGGVPGKTEQFISLHAGVNTIAFQPVGTDAPFIDKISLTPEIVSLEAEDAELIGGAAVVQCAAASGGEQVNMGSSSNSGINFNHVAVPTAGAYRLTISYMSAVPRVCRLLVNGDDLGTIGVTPSGGWCYQGGSTAETEHLVQLERGVNTISFRPVGTEAPFIDKINVLPDITSMEAEHATLIGGATVVQCGTASGGEQVNIGSSVNNGLSFNHVTTQTAGTYHLLIGYMSAVTRQCKLIVNGNDLGTISVDPSGSWCYQGGSPAETEQVISLQSGVNTITFRPVGTDAPFIDKISLLQEAFSMEAEDADLIGSATVVQCATSSGGEQVNPGTSTNNGVRFEDVTIQREGTYRLSIAYMSAVTRECQLTVNGGQPQTITFEPSGGWCYQDGVPAIKSVDLELQEGLNTIEFKPTGSNAPFLDKIAIVESTGQLNASQESMGALRAQRGLARRPEASLYPNPARPHARISISLHGDPGNREINVQIFTMDGVKVFERTEAHDNGKIHIHPALNAGLYYITIRSATHWQTERLIVK